jgi:hypothetical protein
VAVLRRRPDFYAQRHAEPQDILFLVEVADASLEVDRETKLPLYARAGVPEVWLVNLPLDTIEVFRRPSPQGYQEALTVRCGEHVSPGAFPELKFAVADILG